MECDGLTEEKATENKKSGVWMSVSKDEIYLAKIFWVLPPLFQQSVLSMTKYPKVIT